MSYDTLPEKPDFILKLTRMDLLKILPSDDTQIRIDLGCGSRKQSGHIGVDRLKLPNVDIVADLDKELPFADSSIDKIYSNFLFEHLPNTVELFKELYRVTSNGAIIEFRIPWYQSLSQYKDPTHCSVITPDTLKYMTPDSSWYGSDYEIGVRFKTVHLEYSYYAPFDRLMSRKLYLFRFLTRPFLSMCRRFLWNVVHSVKITIVTQK